MNVRHTRTQCFVAVQCTEKTASSHINKTVDDRTGRYTVLTWVLQGLDLNVRHPRTQCFEEVQCKEKTAFTHINKTVDDRTGR